MKGIVILLKVDEMQNILKSMVATSAAVNKRFVKF